MVVVFWDIHSVGFCQMRDHQEDRGLVFYEGFESGGLTSGWNIFSVTTHKNKDKLKRTKGRKQTEQIEIPIQLQQATRSLKIVTSPVRQGVYALKVTVHPDDTPQPGDAKKEKSRAEIGIRDVGHPGTEGWYAWSVLIPEDYIDLPKGHKGFQIITQFHRYTKRVDDQYIDAQELPRNIREQAKGAGPTVAVHYGYQDGQSGFALRYGTTHPKDTWTQPIEKGQWFDWILHIRWSQGQDGFIEGWLNGKPVTPFNGVDYKAYGPNMYTPLPVAFKIGLYRGHKIQTANSVYFDEIRIGASRDEIIP